MRKINAVLVTLGITFILLLGVIELPQFGAGSLPTHNEVSKYYIENAIKDTGATNIVTGIILDYRAFDTFVEASVLFTSAITVLVVLKKNKE
ncbi:hydrogen gas-evolving membrane-bound hydrogenase subunit E [uncultured Clostridium sp.]|uniref:hydrogen gas-evolving membrane-bound hydrogenase subunit E n=1 Tax=uncultured Clostridium sp. TaxID=59620 RepID=UPI0028E27FDC|nr:hydrogen gas-evolving membrane-bound hydrogenase subunit E [uncultured Clostridium sp.]